MFIVDLFKSRPGLKPRTCSFVINSALPCGARRLALAERYGAKHYDPDVVACAKDICTYVYETYGRFPAHVDAFHAPGIWVQAHHLAPEYYDSLYVHGYSETQAQHDELWHG